jgi:hypothetical protein
MAYTQRTKDEILTSLLARMVARSPVTDIVEGSVIYTLLSSVAEQIADSEYKLAKLRQQFTLTNTSGTDLDDRALEIGISRLQPTNATGEITLTRASTGSTLTLDTGLKVSNPSNQALVYYTREAAVFGTNDQTTTVSIIAGVAGSVGNALNNAITRLENFPSSIISCTNINALTNGLDEETDDQLRNRCKQFIQSLAKSQPQAIQTLAKSYIATDGTRAFNAAIYESDTLPAYCELLIDDGSALYNNVVTQTIASTSFAVYGDQSPLVMPVSSPITDSSNLVLTRTRGSLVINPNKYRIIHERGLIIFLDRSDLVDGDFITTSSYSIYTGLISELQNLIEGSSADPINNPGYRAAGVRVRVLPAPITLVSFDLQITAYNGVDLVALQARLQGIANGFVNTLEAGQPLLIAQLIDALMNDTDLQNVKVYSSATLNLSPDIYPTTQRHILKADTINLFVSTRR